MSNRFMFRAWDIKYKKMHDGDIRAALAYPQEDVILMQSTGLKDKNGKLCFEGDILMSVEGEDKGYKWIVKHKDDYHCCFYLEFTSGGEQTMYGCAKREIIGNIHENPELLEARSDT